MKIMLYEKNTGKKLDEKLFQNPTAAYRGTPFWAWNCKLDNKMILEQVDIFKEMGLGGFHMHPRTGLDTNYLSDEFMDSIRTCVEKAKSQNMLAWLYDEDRWPSGAAGGLVTANKEHRERYLLFATGVREDVPALQYDGKNTANDISLIALFDVTLYADGTLQSYRLIQDKQQAKGKVYSAYLKVSEDSSWFNNQAYVNTLDGNAIQDFISKTYDKYNEVVGGYFGETIPAIFTDEPQFARKSTLKYAHEEKEMNLPWTDDFPVTYKKVYGDDIIAQIPELIWELPDGQVSTARYRYHDHISERFAAAFADQCGKWCDDHGILFTGHMMEEPTLESQTAALGDAMRSYRGFGLPGIDMLCDQREYTTAKQAQSASRQYGRPGVLSELYGVTNWDFDFRNHKLQGDWQAALGITTRVHHLAWMSMEGEAKRDYPASIFYQSPWYKEYPMIEDHFARLNTALTRGKACVNVAVVHPVESYWLHWGPNEQTSAVRTQMDENFMNLAEWLLLGNVDFDYICESLLPGQCVEGTNPLAVGEMSYKTVIVPACETIRSTTLERLEKFAEQGGKLIFLGDCPRYVDAVVSVRAESLYGHAQHVAFAKDTVLAALEDDREIDIRDAWGKRTDHLLYQLRQDGDRKWLFICNGTKPENPDLVISEMLDIGIKGKYSLSLYDTMTGKVNAVNGKYVNGKTVFQKEFYYHDSFLMALDPYSEEVGGEESPCASQCDDETQKAQFFLEKVPVMLSEPNALLLDMAQYSVDGGEFEPLEEILRIENLVRTKIGLPNKTGTIAQPWVTGHEIPTHKVTLRFTIHSEINVDEVMLAVENPRVMQILWNGEPVVSDPKGYYVDQSIQKVELGRVIKGHNRLELTIPYGIQTNLDWCYLLGDFGVRVSGSVCTIIPLEKQLTFGSYTTQGLPFYTGNLTYKLKVNVPNGRLKLHVSRYRGALLGISVDGKRAGSIVFAPYDFEMEGLETGEHEVEITVFGFRQNGFGAVHNCNTFCLWFGPNEWRTEGDHWSYEYCLKPMGILKSPEVYV